MPLAEIAEYKARKSKDEEETDGDRIEFPSLREYVTDPPLQQIGNDTDQTIESGKFDQAYPERLGRFAQGKETEQPFIEERQVRGHYSQQDD
jgi:hypothetical protein